MMLFLLLAQNHRTCDQVVYSFVSLHLLMTTISLELKVVSLLVAAFVDSKLSISKIKTLK